MGQVKVDKDRDLQKEKCEAPLFWLGIIVSAESKGNMVQNI